MNPTNHGGDSDTPFRQTSAVQPPPPPAGWQPGVAAAPPPPGWQPAPAGPVTYGSTWQRMSGADKTLIIFGFIGAVLFPLIGVILGFIVLGRGHSKAAAGWILGIGFVNIFASLAMMSNGTGGWLVDL